MSVLMKSLAKSLVEEKYSSSNWHDTEQLVTELDKKRGLALALSLQGKPREVALEITPEDLNVDEGVDKLIIELDKLFEKDKTDQAYAAYTAFDKYHRESSIKMCDYIIEFEQKYNKCKKYDMPLPDAILAFKLLDNAGLGESDRHLALTACSDLKFETMKAALNRIFASKSQSDNDIVTVKEESAFVGEHRFDRGRSSRRFGARNRMNRSFDQRNTQSKLNPTINGSISRCRCCDSKYHWFRDCPHKTYDVKLTEEQTDTSETVNITLITTSQQNITPQEIFVAEAFNAAAVVDTACTKTVCGTKWLHQFLDTDSANEEINARKANTPFKFGDGKTVHSYQSVKLPATIGSLKCYIETEVVDFDVHFTSNGHYCINIKDRRTGQTDSVVSEEEILKVDSGFSKKRKRDIISKLHKQFGHASSEKLLSLLKSAGSVDSDTKAIVNDVCSKCIVCFKYQRPKPKPIVGFSHANDFNQIVAMDLHEIDHNFYYLHIIDLFSRLSAAAIIRRKDSQLVVDKFMQIWVSVYGAPEVGVYTDNGGEFNSQIFRDMAENLNMSVKTTAGYSPWSNGIVERHNATLTETVNKIRESSNLSWETAISWAVNAKNSLVNVYWYSPYQIVFGRNPNLPSTLVNKPPALEGETMTSESSEKIRRALRKQVRPSGEKFRNGDKVYFLRDNQWKGPGTVIGQDNVVVFIRYGGTYVRVHECRILRDIDEQKDKKNKQQEKRVTLKEGLKTQNLNKNKAEHEVLYYDSDEEEDSHANNQSDNEQGESDNEVEGHESELGSQAGDSELDSDNPVNQGHESYEESRSGGDSELDNDDHEDTPVSEQSNEQATSVAHSRSVGSKRHKALLLKKDQKVNFKMPGDDTPREGVVLSRAGKASSSKKNWYNVEYRKPDELKAELENWKKHHVYQEVEDYCQSYVSTRWVYTIKEADYEIHRKARLVAKGFEEDCLDEIQKNSPTCDKQSLRLILSIIMQKKWSINSIDIKTAFLQGEKMQRKVHLRPPKEANANGKLWLLEKCVYGLADASLKWYEKVKKTLNECGGTESKIDPAVFYWHNSNGLAGVLAVHVDDFLWAGTNLFETEIISKIREKFSVGKEASESFKYLGLGLSHADDKIILSQTDYVEVLKTVSIDRKRPNDSQLSSVEQTVLRSKVGQLLWLAKQTRPDIAFDIAMIASKLKTSTIEDFKRVNKLLRKVRNDPVSLHFKELGEHVELLLYTDASFGNLPDGGSQGGFVIMLLGENGKINPITWQSKKIRRVVRSTLASEALALADGIDCATSLATLYNELVFNKCTTEGGITVRCVIDNKDLYEAVRSKKNVTEKRLRL
ncbi:unnamed protein product [Mytilus edulis]|uniref:Integrase catalytic domain-containing protein n=1 Tax=Mytilus edulis TaxID=6550 RepID=A0A8S3TUL7_MYTED|nr:unnamed protein product [Mytilus edulis]